MKTLFLAIVLEIIIFISYYSSTSYAVHQRINKGPDFVLEETGDPVMLHDPTRLTDGIDPSDDPILAVHRRVYEESVAHSTGGWKGRLAALERKSISLLKK